MTWHIYAADGRRVQRCYDPAWVITSEQLPDWFGFAGSHTYWRPTWFASRMQRGWRLFELDVGEHDFVHNYTVASWWRPANPDHRRFPNIAALEMWIRHVGMRS